MVSKDKLVFALNRYFEIGDSYTYTLDRSKTGFAYGTVDVDDFVEWTQEDTESLAEYIMRIVGAR